MPTSVPGYGWVADLLTSYCGWVGHDYQHSYEATVYCEGLAQGGSRRQLACYVWSSTYLLSNNNHPKREHVFVKHDKYMTGRQTD